MTGAVVAALVVRYGICMLFLPFSALDKVFYFGGAVKQAGEVFAPPPLSAAVLLVGLAIEIGCTLGVVTGMVDRAYALVIAGYCAVPGRWSSRVGSSLSSLTRPAPAASRARRRW